MTRAAMESLTGRFAAYTDGFRAPDGRLAPLLQLKLDHTRGVVADAQRLLEGEAWPPETRPEAEAAALLHDAGRFEQFRDHGTFQDARSFDHAARSVAVVEREGWLAELSDAERRRVLAAVLAHNKRELPDGMDAATARLAHLVRDADKLDIFRVLEAAVTDGTLASNPEIAWGLRIEGAPSPELVAAIVAGRPVCYSWIRTLSDFVLIQVGWVNGGFSTRTALRLVRERRVVAFRERCLQTLSDDPGVAACCAAARRHLAACLGEEAA